MHTLNLLDGVKLNRKAGQGKAAEGVVDDGYTVIVAVTGEQIRTKAERIGGEDGGQCTACVIDGVDEIGEGNKCAHIKILLQK